MTWRQVYIAIGLTLLGMLILVPLVASVLTVLITAFGVFDHTPTPHLMIAPFAPILRSVWTGMSATALAILAALGLCAAIYGTFWHRWIQTFLAPLYAIPHAAMAVAFVFLFTPTGLFFRALGYWQRPPTLTTAPDTSGLALLIVLAIKEFVFILLLTWHYANSEHTHQAFATLRTLGIPRQLSWYKGVLPLIAARLRLPILVALVYALSVVDMSEILLLGNVHTLATLIVQTAQQPELHATTMATRMGLVLIVVIIVIICLGVIGERSLREPLKRLWLSGSSHQWLIVAMTLLGLLMALLSLLTGIAALFFVPLRAMAGNWRFPDLLPQLETSLPFAWPFDAQAVVFAIVLGVTTTLISMITVITLIDALERHTKALGAVMILPLIIPQAISLLGAYLLGIILALPSWLLVWIGHFVMVTPYVYFLLKAPLTDFDPRYIIVAKTLKCAGFMALWRVKYGLLKRQLALIFGIGITVSNTQYLATQLLGGGRIETPTTVAVVLASGAFNTGQVALAALTQTAINVAALTLVIGVPAVLDLCRRYRTMP